MKISQMLMLVLHHWFLIRDICSFCNGRSAHSASIADSTRCDLYLDTTSELWFCQVSSIWGSNGLGTWHLKTQLPKQFFFFPQDFWRWYRSQSSFLQTQVVLWTATKRSQSIIIIVDDENINARKLIVDSLTSKLILKSQCHKLKSISSI